MGLATRRLLCAWRRILHLIRLLSFAFLRSTVGCFLNMGLGSDRLLHPGWRKALEISSQDKASASMVEGK